MDDDKPSGIEEDMVVDELNLVEIFAQDHFNVSCFCNPLETCLTNSCDFIFCGDSTHGLEVNAWKQCLNCNLMSPNCCHQVRMCPM